MWFLNMVVTSTVVGEMYPYTWSNRLCVPSTHRRSNHPFKPPTVSSNSSSSSNNSYNSNSVITTTVTTATQFPEFGQRQTGKEPDRPSPMGNCEPAEVSYCARNRPIDSFPVIKINQFSQHNPIQFNPQTINTDFNKRKSRGR